LERCTCSAAFDATLQQSRRHRSPRRLSALVSQVDRWAH
jgi:hypothetical protein